MAKYIFAYHGGSAPESPEEHAKVMDAWGQWMGSMDSDLIDGGNPAGPSTTILPDLSVVNNGGSNPISGYSLVEAISMEDAIAKGKRCPIFSDGGSIEIAEAFDM